MRCDEGYCCRVCGEDVKAITESELYLRFVLGEVPLEKLHLMPECHIRCNTALSQYIVAPEFPVVCDYGDFRKEALDPEFVQLEELRVTRAWQRLQQVPGLGIPITEYPLS
jgi:hypothetical protein